MPCNSDYLEPNSREREYKRAAKLLVYICDATKRKLPSVSYRRQALDTYGQNNVVAPHRVIKELCTVMRSLSEDEMNAHVYNGRIAEARDLADWWEEHTAADRLREKQEAALAAREKLIESARRKLTDAEWDAIVNHNVPFA